MGTTILRLDRDITLPLRPKCMAQSLATRAEAVAKMTSQVGYEVAIRSHGRNACQSRPMSVSSDTFQDESSLIIRAPM